MALLRRGHARARLPLCISAALGLHAVVASALPARSRRPTAAVLAEPLASPLDIDHEPPGPASDERATAQPHLESAAAPARAPLALPLKAAATPRAEEIVTGPDDSASDATAKVPGDGWDVDDGSSGRGGGLGGRGADGHGTHDHHIAGSGRGGKSHHSVGKASLDVGRDWSDCPFPKDSRRKTAFVRIVVAVDAQGDPTDVRVLSDPGEGFAESASLCAKRRHYVAGTTDDGRKAATETEPFLVYFTR